MLTTTQIDKAIKNCTKETLLNDGTSGRGGGTLCLRIRKTEAGASAVWVAQWMRNKKRGAKQLGRYPDLSLADAREKFGSQVRGLLMDGKNPLTVAAQADEKPTVENLFKRYVENLKGRGARSAGHIEQVLLLGKYNAADALGRDTLAGEVEAADIRKPLAATAKRGALRTADILRTYMAAAFSWGMHCANDYTTADAYDWRIKFNPVSAIPRDQRANKKRERNLSAPEMREVWSNAPADGSGDVMRLIMLCGQRVQETIRVDGCEIDLAGALWNMPAEKTKGGKHPHTIPLPRQAVAIFRRLIEVHGDGPLFPARTGSKHERMGLLAVSHTAARLTCCKPFQPRDLRRTWKSRAGDAGIDRFTRDLIQQHAKSDTGSRHYDHADYLPKMRAAMKVWEKWIDAHVVRKQPLRMVA
jgi:integrase